jgi:hypothetical protein
MSRAAEDYVETLPLKGSALELLRTIAKHIPEGQTTTPPMTTDELATPAKQSEKTARRNRDASVRDGLICVHDGGRGNVARYEILNLAGERPITAMPLPLLGRTKPRHTKEQRSTLVTMTNLFDETLVKVTNDRDNWWARIVNVGQIVRRCIQTLVTLTNDRAYALGHFVRRCAPPWRRLVRARDVLQLKTTTTTAPSADAPIVTWPPCRWHGTTHAFCDGRVHVPMAFHLEERRKLARQPGETDADLDEKLFARYRSILAAIPDAEDIRDRNEFVFWNRMMRSAPREATPKARAPTRETRAPIPDNDLFARAAEERRQRYGGS